MLSTVIYKQDVNMLLSVERGLDVPFGQNFPSPCPRAHTQLIKYNK